MNTVGEAIAEGYEWLIINEHSPTSGPGIFRQRLSLWADNHPLSELASIAQGSGPEVQIVGVGLQKKDVQPETKLLGILSFCPANASDDPNYKSFKSACGT